MGALGAVIAAALLGGSSPVVMLAAMAVTGALTGGGWLGLCGALRSLRGVNETISSLLLNYVAIAFFKQMVEGPLRDPASLNKPSTVPIGEANMLGNVPGMDVHYGLVYGLCACVLGYALMRRTVFGFSARMVGGNVRAALLSGISVHSRIVITCALAGAAGGLAGMVEVAAVHGSANASLIAGYGYAGILVAFLARQNPLAVIPIALLLGGINASGGLLQRSFELPDATVNVLQGILFVVILGSETLYGRWFQPAANTVPALPKIEPVLGKVA
jgi:simple sugar transport system permease protein